VTSALPLPPHPGLAKARASALVSSRALRLLRCADALWALWFEKVDVVSEGAVSREQHQEMYRGTTSVIVLTDEHGGLLPAKHLTDAAAIAPRDPHFWLRAMRLARREAASRSPGALGCIHVELVVRQDSRGIRADIDVEGRVLSRAVGVKGKR
jgi:hypothetical protein